MPQLEHVPDVYHVKDDIKVGKGVGSGLALQTEVDGDGYQFDFKVIKPNLFRVSFHSSSHPLPPHPSIETPTTEVSPEEVSSTRSGSKQTFEAGGITASVDWSGSPIVSLGWTGSDEPLHSDLPYRSYAVDGQGVAHYTRHDREALHVGLGEVAAPMDLTARNFKIDATDCFGYEPYKTSPMYKHMPFLVKATPKGCVAIVSSSYSRASWSVGAEVDGLWGFYKVYRQDYGGLEEYLIVGKTLKDIVRSYAELVGFPLLAPKWAFGYLSGGYKYTMQDDPPANQYLLDFANKLKEHDIPCSGHQMSSGYSISEVAPKVRNVFTWNKHRFPDPEAFLAQYHALGIRLLSNIKPFILASHPDFEKLKAAKGMFTNPKTNDMAYVRLWSAGGGESDVGGHLDFTCPTTYEWWRNGVRRLREQGVDAMWNDNNEYTLPNDTWQMSLADSPSPSSAPNAVGLWGRAMQTELMGKASYQGLLDAEPGIRPFVLTRSATIGTMRWCCSSWSGDNMTSWEGMKGANAIGLTAGVSLLHQYGHDIGGFEGPQPSPELLLRWVQIGIYGPRFAINCFKTSKEDNSRGEVIEPWMYPEITADIRKAIKRRYEILPYIYSLGLESHKFASPPQRWIGWGYEQDPEVWSKRLKRGEEQFWFGDALLVGGVYEPGVDVADVYLPRKNGEGHDYGYVNLNAPFEYHASGQWVKISSPWKNHIPVLAKVGSAVPVGKSVQTRMAADTNPACKTLEEDDYRGLEIFPPKGSSHGTTFMSSWYEDDGLSIKPDITRFECTYSSTEEKITVEVTVPTDDKFVPVWKEVTIILPMGDERHVVSGATGMILEKLDSDESGRRRYRLPGVSKVGTVVNGYH
ncbi:putative glycosyl hydrolases family 31 protein 2 [Elsinoe fawcettii]|nr:putative glycosyl hydrolases family 31 protein 2 [Elsinoe fawcettii]